MVVATKRASDVLRNVKLETLAPFTLRNKNGQMCPLGVLYAKAGGNWDAVPSSEYSETILSVELQPVRTAIKDEFGLNLEEQGVIEDLFDNTVKDYLERTGRTTDNIGAQDAFNGLMFGDKLSVLEEALGSCVAYLQSVEA